MDLSSLRIGIDFDNTLISYEKAFYSAAYKANLISKDTPQSKKAVRDCLRESGQEQKWTLLQGEVYGPGIFEAKVFNGVQEFFKKCYEIKIPVFIISHKTKTPFMGTPHDLHAAARSFLEQEGFFDKFHLPRDRVFFEPSIEQKISRIAQEQCTHFIDDLPEILNHENFPIETKKILFDPNSEKEDFNQFEYRTSSWSEVMNILLKAR